MPSNFIPSTPMSSPCHYEVFRTLKFRHTLHIPLRSTVFKLSSAGDTRDFRKHISFIMKLVHTILVTVLHFLVPPHICVQSALLYFKCKSLFFQKKRLFKKCFRNFLLYQEPTTYTSTLHLFTYLLHGAESFLRS